MMASGETLVIERHGEPIGFFVPIAATDRAEGVAAVDHLGETLNKFRRVAGVSESELADEISKPRRGR